MIWNEPARGRVPDPSWTSLPGIDRARAMLRLEVPRPPLSRLTGMGATQIGAGSATTAMPVSEAMSQADGTMDSVMLLQDTLVLAAMTSLPTGSDLFPATLCVHHLRPCTMDGRSLVARAHVVNTGPRYTLVEALAEDALGRAVAHAVGSVIVESVVPPPEPWAGAGHGEEPVYATPDPYRRELEPPHALMQALDGDWLPAFQRVLAGDLPNFPVFDLLGIRITDVGEGGGGLALRTSDWLRDIWPSKLSTAPLAQLGHSACILAAGSLCPAGHRVGVVQYDVNVLRPVAVDGRDLVARARVTNRSGDLLAVSGELIDAHGAVVALPRISALLIKRRHPRDGAPPAERALATVLFTDLVESTVQAERLGDAAWSRLLSEHHDTVRRHLETWKGKEVKTTGDGFLATFDSPARALQCARGIRDSVRRLGLEVRAGAHTGECEISRDDVAGIAVHVAARVMGAADPGEILVSNTVKDLVAGSGLRFSDRGRHQLKGIAGEWQLHALAD